MPQSPKPLRRNTPAGLRPGQDFLPSKQTAQFPGVGMTLNTYRQQNSAASATAVMPRPVAAKARPKKGWWRAITLKRVVITLLIIVLLIGGYVGGKFLYNTHKLFGGSLFGLFESTKLKGEDRGRVNILLAGNSADDPGHQGGDLTDSIMIVSIDTVHHTAFMLSVPRDLYVSLPDGAQTDSTGHAKINQAILDRHFSASGYPDGGMGLLEQTVSQDFGIPIDYYALIDYNAFRDAVNAVGGITVNIQSSDPRGLYDPNRDYTTGGPLVKLSNGIHQLNGEQALDLARARGDPSPYGIPYGFEGSDFERTQNQRMMLIALKSKAASAGVLANPAKLSNLFDAVGNNVHTDLQLSQVRRLYDLTNSIGSGSITSVSLNSANGKNLLASYSTPYGESALIPAAGLDDFSQIQHYVEQLTSSNPVVQEAATVVVLNASDSAGLASQERTKLTSRNIDVTAIGDAQAPQATTTIIDNSAGKKPATRQLLGQLFGNHFTTVNPYSGYYTADFIVLIGADQASQLNSNTSTSSQ